MNLKQKKVAAAAKRFVDKDTQNIAEEKYGIKQGEKQLARKTEVADNYWNLLAKAVAQITEEEFDNIDCKELWGLCYSYEDFIADAKYL